jgi:hypothetical protein
MIDLDSQCSSPCQGGGWEGEGILMEIAIVCMGVAISL